MEFLGGWLKIHSRGVSLLYGKGEQRQKDVKKVVENVFTSYFPELWLCQGDLLLGVSVRECGSLPGGIAHDLWTCAGFRSIQGAITQTPSFSLILPHNFCSPPSIARQ